MNSHSFFKQTELVHPMTTSMPEVPPPPSASLQKGVGVLRMIARTVSALILIGVAVPVLGFASLFAPGPLQQDKTVVIARGTHTADIGAQLAKENAVYFAPIFHAAAKFAANGTLKAGEYAIPAYASPLDIVTMLHEGRSVERLFTPAEGLTSAEIVDMLNDDPVLTGSVDVPPEGTLLPETYRYSYGDSRSSLIARMQKSMQEKINEVWASREADVPLKSTREAVILASIVEKETGKSDERPRIAGVFYNRLHLNMRLQSDPTVIYAITHGKESLNRPLTHDDLSFASPINTYASDGIPPQPICNPGLAALEAVAHPEHNNFLYFVADGSGGHAFAATLAAHDENINRWHQIERAASRQ
jgi:UPF0755 protein